MRELFERCLYQVKRGNLMHVNHTRWLGSFGLFVVLGIALAGCGGSGGSNPQIATGSISASLQWPGSAKTVTTAKTLFAAPAGVVTIQITVSAADMASISQDFAASAGSGTVSGIPVGTGRQVKVQGLDSTGILRYQALVSGIPIESGKVTDLGVIAMTAPITTASPAGGSYPTAQSVTLTSSTAATIYYTTNGNEPTTNDTNGPSPLILPIQSSSILKFFAIDSGFAREATKTETYTITTGSITVTF